MTDTTDHAAEIAKLANRFNTRHTSSKLRVGAIIEHANALAGQLAEARKEIAYWKSCVEDPYLYWGRDEKPYGRLDDAAPGATAGERG